MEIFFLRNGEGRLSSSSRFHFGAGIEGKLASEDIEAVLVACGSCGGAVAVRDIPFGRLDGLATAVAMDALLLLRFVGVGISTADDDAGLAGKPAGKVVVVGPAD